MWVALLGTLLKRGINGCSLENIGSCLVAARGSVGSRSCGYKWVYFMIFKPFRRRSTIFTGWRSIIYLLTVLSGLFAQAEQFKTSDPLRSLTSQEILKVDEAFSLSVHVMDGHILADWQIADGYYLYRHSFKFAGLDGTALGNIDIPVGLAKVDEFFGDVEVYYGTLEVKIPVVAQSGPLTLDVTYQGCADYGFCYPPKTKRFIASHAVTGPMQEISVANEKNDSRVVLSGKDLANEFLIQEFAIVLFSALIAGLLLNLMPCVFPVLSIKALSVLGATEDTNRVSHAFNYTAGIVVAFLVLGAAVGVLRAAGESIGWGFQLQTPSFVAAMALLFFLIGLNLLGFMEIPGFGVTIGNTSAFGTGVLAVIIASPCNVPLMAGVLGYGLSGGLPVLLPAMAFMGIGLALPYVVITLTPRIARALPKPGEWMVTFRQAMAFPMFATVVWLVWVLSRQSGPNGGLIILASMLGVGFIAWVASLKPGRGVWAWSLAFVLSITSILTVPPGKTDQNIGQPFDLASFDEDVRSDRAIFLNVTAAWCITCLANDRSTLGTDLIREFFQDNEIKYVEADWTNSDASVSALLDRYGRAGVPLYVYFPPVGEAVILPQILTPNSVMDAILASNGA